MSLNSSGNEGSFRHDGAAGFDYCEPARSTAAPARLLSKNDAPHWVAGIGVSTTLKAVLKSGDAGTFRHDADLKHLSLVSHCGGARAWRNDEPAPAEEDSVGMLTFESALYRYEGPVTVFQAHIPIALPGIVCESLFDRTFKHEDVWIPMGARDRRLGRVMESIRLGLRSAEPTNLVLDSWALIATETMFRSFSAHAGKSARTSFGKVPVRGMAQVVDYVEANLGLDLRLEALAAVAAMSAYHFARRFKETVGLAPHAYVLRRRLARARFMLEHGDQGLAQIAELCGFSSQSHLTTLFRQSLGVTPSEFRRMIRL